MSLLELSKSLFFCFQLPFELIQLMLDKLRRSCGDDLAILREFLDKELG